MMSWINSSSSTWKIRTRSSSSTMGRVIVLKNEEVLGAYENELDAVNVTRRRHELGTFLVQRVSAGDEAYTVTFHSRVTLP